MVFNIFSFVLAWFITAITSSWVLFAVFPSDPPPSVVFDLDWRNIPGWILGSVFGATVYRAMRKKDRQRALQVSSPQSTED